MFPSKAASRHCGAAMAPKVGEVHELLRGMPVEDQLVIVLIAIVQANPGALSVSLRMLRVTSSCRSVFPMRTGSRSARRCAMQPTRSKGRSLKLSACGCVNVLYVALGPVTPGTTGDRRCRHLESVERPMGRQ